MIEFVVLAAMVLVIPAVLVLGVLAAACLTIAAMAVTEETSGLQLAMRPGSGGA